jgi:hypothetical protein
MNIIKEPKGENFPKIMEHVVTKNLSIVCDITPNGYPFISLTTGNSGFYTNFYNLVDYKGKVILEN